jgi:hypothetical protein
LWGGITPNLLEKASGFPEICNHIQKALWLHVCCLSAPSHPPWAYAD